MRERKLVVNKMVVALASFFAFAMVAFPDVTEEGSKTAIIIWANSIVPCAVAFFIFSVYKEDRRLTETAAESISFYYGGIIRIPYGSKGSGRLCKGGKALPG